MESLTLPESLILLALNDETGVREGAYVDYALAGAGLAELAMQRILRESGEPPSRFALVSDALTGDAFLDGCAEAIRMKGLDKSPKTLINAIAGTKGLITRLLDQLVDRGILLSRSQKVLFFFNRTVYPEAAPAPERALKARLSEVMFHGGDVTPRDSVLIALAKQTGLLKRNFDHDQLRAHKARIDEIANGKMLATTATAETINAIQTAIMIAVIIPVVVS